MMVPTKLSVDPTTATLISNHQIMIIGGAEKINNNPDSLLAPFQQTCHQTNIINRNELNVARSLEPMQTPSTDSTVTIVEPCDSDINGKPLYAHK